MNTTTKIAVIGGGNMGGALVGGIVAAGVALSSNICVSDVRQERLNELKSLFGVRTTADNKEAMAGADVAILSVKPQNMAEVLPTVRDAGTAVLYISIAAGVPLSLLEEGLGSSARIIRAMPNVPALVREGVTALAAGKNVTKEDLDLAQDVFNSVGTTAVVKEELMDAVTGLSGSGPAYVFVMIEALSDAGVLLGLSRDVSRKLAMQTILGAAKLCLTSGKHAAEWKDVVASPGGTTIAGLKALEEGKLRATLISAVEAATLRSIELGKKR
ncbi:MAG: Pyrroline-5-carboxylate reductase [Syntrophaceae bacterium PtaU1.Bin231]|nr:MAG: Pyrroline-5-carboxylate reductase [Syntrophaceae bacterium PtaU1.Bin231]HOG17003.1 pyrroline-5-carboxylate reductase [Syntrophales bacterium]